MFTKTPIEVKLDEEILLLLSKLKETQKDTDEYAALAKRLSELHKLKIEESESEFKKIKFENELQDANRFKLPSSDTMLTVAANIFGILWIARYEKEHIITSKALGLAMKPR